MRKAFFSLLIFAVAVLLLLYINNVNGLYDLMKNKQRRLEKLPAEVFIYKHLLTEQGLIRTNFEGTDHGDHFLSESMGLWLKYLVLSGDYPKVKKTIHAIEDQFLMNNRLIAWEIRNDKQANTNALIDDLRIIEMLYEAGEYYNEKKWIKLANEIASAVVKFNRHDSYFIDFFDSVYAYANDEITLSYLNPVAFQRMLEYEIIEKTDYEQMIRLLKSIPMHGNFFPKSYNFTEGKFYFDETVNLIDQLYIGIFLEQAGIDNSLLFRWFKEVFYKNKHILGRYDLQTKQPVVEYESIAVYALGIIYSSKRGDLVFAKDLSIRMRKMQVIDATSDYYGGYADVLNHDTHSFDQLLSLIAERILRNADILDE